MIGTSTPRPRTLRIISGTAAAASSVLTVTRTSSDPAWASRATWMAVASASAVSVLVMDWTTIGWALPTRTPPTSTVTVSRRRGRRRSGVATTGLGSAAEAAGDVKAGDPDEEREEEDEPDDVGQALGAQADPPPEQPLEDDHEHPSAIEGREGQDVDDREVRGQQAGDVESDHRPELPEHVADLRRDAHRAGDGWRFGRPMDHGVDEPTETAHDETERLRGAVGTQGDRVQRLVVDRDGRGGRAEIRDTEGALVGLDGVGAAERHGQPVEATVDALHPELHGLPGPSLERVDDPLVIERPEIAAVDALDDVAGLEADRRGRRAGLDPADSDADRRIAAESDPAEDDERQKDVHDDARDEDREPRRQTLCGERSRIVARVAVLALELHEH